MNRLKELILDVVRKRWADGAGTVATFQFIQDRVPVEMRADVGDAIEGLCDDFLIELASVDGCVGYWAREGMALS